MSKRERRSFTTEQKVAILRRHLIDKVPVSDLWRSDRRAAAAGGVGREWAEVPRYVNSHSVAR